MGCLLLDVGNLYGLWSKESGKIRIPFGMIYFQFIRVLKFQLDFEGQNFNLKLYVCDFTSDFPEYLNFFTLS